jgi:uncharacterized protein
MSVNRGSYMVRPRNCRRVSLMPQSRYFKPRGIPLSELEEVILTVDEFEAIRLADHEGLYQEQAAEKMNVSRQTFGRIIESGHRKVSEALVQGKALKIEGGQCEVTLMRRFRCEDCQHSWDLSYGTGKPESCPSCEGSKIYRAQEDGSCAGDSGKSQGRCCRGSKRKQEGKPTKDV